MLKCPADEGTPNWSGAGADVSVAGTCAPPTHQQSV